MECDTSATLLSGGKGEPEKDVEVNYSFISLWSVEKFLTYKKPYAFTVNSKMIMD
jgi:hypothetical protein